MEDACFSCLNCAGEACEYETGENPPQCVQGLVTDEVHEEVHGRYADPENHRIMKAAVMTSERCSNLTRVQETIEVFGVACKVESNHRDDLDLVLEDGKRGSVLCNPIMQARLLDQAGTDLNVVMGLCVGHDTLFYKHSHAPTTTLVTKDHITGNNACAGLYASKTVYRRRLNETIQACRDQTLPRA